MTMYIISIEWKYGHFGRDSVDRVVVFVSKTRDQIEIKANAIFVEYTIHVCAIKSLCSMSYSGERTMFVDDETP